MARARTNTKDMTNDLITALGVVRSKLDLEDPAVSDAMAEIETFSAIALRVMAKTNPSKIRSEAVLVNIQALMPAPPGSRKPV